MRNADPNHRLEFCIVSKPHFVSITIYEVRHPWAVNYLVMRIHSLMTQGPPDPMRAQYYVHALKSLDEGEAIKALNDLSAWWRNEINDAYTHLLDYAVRNPVRPC